MNSIGHGTRRCKFCDRSISERATVCEHCNRNQVWWRLHFSEGVSLAGVLLSFAGVLVSLAMVFLAGAQFRSAATERSRAEAALAEARKIRKASDELHAEQDRLIVAVHRAYVEDFSNLCKASNGQFSDATGTCQLPSGQQLVFSDPFKEN
jgi:uncharacterized iron-regulated membrane protein